MASMGSNGDMSGTNRGPGVCLDSDEKDEQSTSVCVFRTSMESEDFPWYPMEFLTTSNIM